MMLGSPVHAADSISFVIDGHRVHIEAPRHAIRRCASRFRFRGVMKSAAAIDPTTTIAT
jgi:hypothetical protein